ncbi:hypothetical protein ACFY3O_28205 [Streptomyces sp. NPDC001046]|uniref:hypothetical protein n=1 Tax=Streptomyces sp. NPDC001046 TaxID=3364543 RepID=UPI0036C1FC39
MIAQLRFDSLPEAARSARRALSEYLGRHGVLCGPDGVKSASSQDALLAVSELVTHVCRSTTGPYHLGMLIEQGRLHLEVAGRNGGAGSTAPHGGLGFGPAGGLVGEWYVATNSDGKAIRVTLPI